MDVQHRRGLVDDRSQPGPVLRVAGAGSGFIADVSSGDSGRRRSGYHRPAKVSGQHGARDRAGIRRLRAHRVARCRHAREPTAVHVSQRRALRGPGPRLAGRRAAARSRAEPAGRDRCEQRRHQCQPSRRPRVILGRFGLSVPFWINAVSYLGMVGVRVCWRPQQRGRRHLPVEQFGSAIRTGFRHAKNNPHLQATMVRSAAFFLFATAYGALLPLIAREQIAGGPDLFGFILAVIGAGAVGGAFALRWLESKLGADWLVAAGTIGTAIAMTLFAVARGPALALLASVIAGAGWTVAVATLNVSAQIALPDWVRGRGLAMFATVLFGATAAGSAIWGQAASIVGLQGAQFIAAAGLLAAIPLTWRWKLGTGANVDLTPSMHWPDPIVTHDVERHQGPVLVTVEYRINPRDRDQFIAAMAQLGYESQGNGAYGWVVSEDSASEGRMLETFLVESWLEHLRQRERVTNEDRVLQDLVNQFQTEDVMPKITHFIGRERD